MKELTNLLEKSVSQANITAVLLNSIKESISEGDNVNIKNLKCIKSNLYDILSVIQELETKEELK